MTRFCSIEIVTGRLFSKKNRRNNMLFFFSLKNEDGEWHIKSFFLLRRSSSLLDDRRIRTKSRGEKKHKCDRDDFSGKNDMEVIFFFSENFFDTSSKCESFLILIVKDDFFSFVVSSPIF
eukprot:GDKK01016536.1.p1 GENE.GDKK01016536.1~~GDKK01016536.1.p1  ORF type:complete len:120 (-),score=21.72 GDKK01016536.1:62-421(-)